MAIEKFTGDYRFLSNFYPCSILYHGIVYPSVEHAYQAAKACDGQEMQKHHIAQLSTAAAAKKFGRSITMRDDWDKTKLEVMELLVRMKFTPDPLRTMLHNTGTHELIEGNHWNDTFWGVCRGKGENHLGKILMKVREQNRHQGSILTSINM